MQNRLLTYLQDFLFLLYPTPCSNCEQYHPYLKNTLCPDCYFDLTQKSPYYSSLCSFCGSPCHPLETKKEYELCPHYPFKGSGPQSIRSLSIYSGKMEKLIKQYKFHEQIPLAKAFGKCLLSPPKPPWEWNELSALVPVPMHQSRYMERGFDQVLFLAHALKSWLKKQQGIQIPLEPKFLRLKKPFSHQLGLSQRKRLKNVEKLARLIAVKKKKENLSTILLLDDVVTTGATLYACSKAIHRVYPHMKIHCLTLARTTFPQQMNQ